MSSNEIKMDSVVDELPLRANWFPLPASWWPVKWTSINSDAASASQSTQILDTSKYQHGGGGGYLLLKCTALCKIRQSSNNNADPVNILNEQSDWSILIWHGFLLFILDVLLFNSEWHECRIKLPCWVYHNDCYIYIFSRGTHSKHLKASLTLSYQSPISVTLSN